MDINEIRAVLRGHWAFRLFNRFSRIPSPFVASAISVVIFVVGAVASLFVGAFSTYATNPIPYIFLVLLPVGFMAFAWWTKTLVRMLHSVYPAMEVTQVEYKAIIERWDRSRLHRPWAIALGGLPLALANLNEIVTNWRSANPVPIYASWATSPASLFFGIWLIVLTVIVAGFVLGSGLVGIIATILLVRSVLQWPLRLAYCRQLRAVSGLGVGLATWSILALAAVLLFPDPILLVEVDLTATFVGAVLEAALGLTALACSFGPPFLFSHQAVVDAKAVRLAELASVQDYIFGRMSQYAQRAVRLEFQDKNHRAQLLNQLETLHNESTIVNELVREIDDISAWPISIPSLARLFGSAMVAILPSTAPWLISQAVAGR